MSDRPSTSWQEVVPDDEAAQFEAFAQEITCYQNSFARRGDGRPHRGFHVKSHAGLRGTFRVDSDVPGYLRYGIFKAPRSFSAWVRFSNGFSAARHDWLPDMLGCSVKLEGVEGDKLLPNEAAAETQDFIALNQPYIPADDARQLMVISTASANVLTAPAKLLRGLGLAHTLRVMLWSVRWAWRHLRLRSVATEDFYGIAPISIGPHAVKFKWQSKQTATRSSRSSWNNYLRDELRQRLATGDLRFDFLVQLYIDPATTPLDGAYEWKPADAPFVKVAELTIPGCDLDASEAKRYERQLNGLAFNPWHAIAEHRPLGNIQRGRRVVYQASAHHWGHSADPSGSHRP